MKYEIDKLRRMLELTCELEGLLDLAISREDVSDLLNNLIEGKMEAIRALKQSLQPKEESEVNTEFEKKVENHSEEAEEDFNRDIEEEESEGKLQHNPGKQIRTFSINDRFLYSRELFGGDTAAFENALKEVAGIESYEEAEEFFYSEYNLDPDNPVVADFMIRISKYFE